VGAHLPSPPRQPGCVPIAAPPEHGLRWLSLSRLSLRTAGASWDLDSGPDEVGIDILGGVGALAARGPSGQTEFAAMGQRGQPFEGPPTMVYLPRSTVARLTCLTPPLEAILFRVQARRDTLPRLLRPGDVPAEDFGRSNWSRSVYPCIGPEVDTDRLMMGETHSPSGSWSSYPPHKHDCERPPEHVSEEIYHFLINPPFGFGLQTMWTPPARNEEPEQTAYVVHNGDSVIIPSGYHPVVVAPGFRMITVWAYAGDLRVWGAWAAEPEFARLLDQSDAPCRTEGPDDHSG
jgi:5-deoxy-glucuronate isomerase